MPLTSVYTLNTDRARNAGALPFPASACRLRFDLDRAHPSVFAYEIHDAPAAVPLLHVFDRERGHFGPAQSAAQEHR
jgi:hypothetical protein